MNFKKNDPVLVEYGDNIYTAFVDEIDLEANAVFLVGDDGEETCVPLDAITLLDTLDLPKQENPFASTTGVGLEKVAPKNALQRACLDGMLLKVSEQAVIYHSQALGYAMLVENAEVAQRHIEHLSVWLGKTPQETWDYLADDIAQLIVEYNQLL